MQRLSALGLTLSLAACGNATAPAEDYLLDLGPRDAGYDGALSFDGVDDYASVGTARAPHLKRDQTIMLWFRPEADPEGGALQVLFSLHRSQESGFALALDEGVPFVYKVYGGRDLARAGDAPAPSRWHHLAFVIQAEQSLLYVDGAKAGESTAELTNRTPTQAFLGSADGFERPFHGAVDVAERPVEPDPQASRAPRLVARLQVEPTTCLDQWGRVGHRLQQEAGVVVEDGEHVPSVRHAAELELLSVQKRAVFPARAQAHEGKKRSDALRLGQ